MEKIARVFVFVMSVVEGDAVDFKGDWSRGGEGGGGASWIKCVSILGICPVRRVLGQLLLIRQLIIVSFRTKISGVKKTYNTQAEQP